MRTVYCPRNWREVVRAAYIILDIPCGEVILCYAQEDQTEQPMLVTRKLKQKLRAEIKRLDGMNHARR